MSRMPYVAISSWYLAEKRMKGISDDYFKTRSQCRPEHESVGRSSPFTSFLCAKERVEGRLKKGNNFVNESSDLLSLTDAPSSNGIE